VSSSVRKYHKGYVPPFSSLRAGDGGGDDSVASGDIPSGWGCIDGVLPLLRCSSFSYRCLLTLVSRSALLLSGSVSVASWFQLFLQLLLFITFDLPDVVRMAELEA